MIAIKIDFWSLPSDADDAPLVTIDTPDDPRSGRVLAAAIRAGKAGAGTGRSTSLSYSEFAQTYDAAAAGARANGDLAAALRHEASAARMRETTKIVSGFGAIRDAVRTSAPERSGVLTVSDLAATANALGNRWSAACLRIADDLSMDMTGQPTLFDVPDDANPALSRKIGRKAVRKIGRFEPAAVKRLSAKLPAVHMIDYSAGTGRPAVDPAALRDVYSSANGGWFVQSAPVATWETATPATEETTMPTSPITVAPHGFEGCGRRCTVAGCDAGRTAKIHAAARAAERAERAERIAAGRPAEVSATPAVAAVPPAGVPMCGGTRDGFSAHSRRPVECRFCGRPDSAHAEAPTAAVAAPEAASVDIPAGFDQIFVHTTEELTTELRCKIHSSWSVDADFTVMDQAFSKAEQHIRGSHTAATVAPVDATPGESGHAVTERLTAVAQDRRNVAHDLISRSSWNIESVTTGRRGERRRWTAYVMRLPSDAGRLSRDTFNVVRDTLSGIAPTSWNREASGFVFETGDSGNQWRKATPSGRERVAAWLAQVTLTLDSGDQGDQGDMVPAGTVDARVALPDVITHVVPTDGRALPVLPAGILGTITMSPQPADYDPFRAQIRGCACPVCEDLAANNHHYVDPRKHVHSARVLLAHLVAGTHVHQSYADCGAEAKALHQAEIDAARAAGATADEVDRIEHRDVYMRLAAREAVRDSMIHGSGLGIGDAPIRAERAERLAREAAGRTAETPAEVPAVALVDTVAPVAAEPVTVTLVYPSDTVPAVATVDAVDQGDEVPAGTLHGAHAQRVHVSGQGDLDGYRFHLTAGTMARQLAKKIKPVLGRERAALGAGFWVTAPAGSRTINIVAKSGETVPDWAPVLAMVAEVIGDALVTAECTDCDRATALVDAN